MGAIRIDNGGVGLHVDDDGDREAPPVLLLHGITNSTATWGWIVPDLARDHRVLRLDFRGHGRSDRAPGTYGMASYVSDAAAVCEQVIGRPCVAIGHSLGGGTAATLAQQRPGLLRGVVLEDPPLGGSGKLEVNSLSGAFAAMRQSIPRFQERGISPEDLAGRLAKAPSSSGPIFAEFLAPDALLAMATALLQLDASVLDPVLEGRVDRLFDHGAPIPVPALLLAADPAFPDAVVQPVDIERLAVASPHARSVVMSGAGHLVHDDAGQRARYLTEVRAFLATLPPA